MSSSKPLASLSLDLDNQWSYIKTHGDAGWESYPTYLPIVVPRFLEIMRELRQSMTVFIVGQDAVRPENRDALASIAEAGHEIGNHSFNHEPWFHLYTPEKIDAELAQTEDALQSATGRRPIGFRGPGFSLSENTLRVLAARGYEYDCSTFPTYLGPLARTYYFMTAKLDAEQKRQRARLFGGLSEGFRPLKPYQWDLGDQSLVELPVTTLPIFKSPIHVSYLLYAACYSKTFAIQYFKSALRMCRMTGVTPSLLLHPLDFLGADDQLPLDFFPAMKLSSKFKVDLVRQILELYADRFRVVSMIEHARAVAAAPRVPAMVPRFRLAN